MAQMLGEREYQQMPQPHGGLNNAVGSILIALAMIIATKGAITLVMHFAKGGSMEEWIESCRNIDTKSTQLKSS